MLAEKPVAVISTCEFDDMNSLFLNQIEGMALALGKVVTCIDAPDSIGYSKILEIDHAAYNRFITDYIKLPESPDLPFWEIVLNTVERREARV